MYKHLFHAMNLYVERSENGLYLVGRTSLLFEGPSLQVSCWYTFLCPFWWSALIFEGKAAVVKLRKRSCRKMKEASSLSSALAVWLRLFRSWKDFRNNVDYTRWEAHQAASIAPNQRGALQAIWFWNDILITPCRLASLIAFYLITVESDKDRRSRRHPPFGILPGTQNGHPILVSFEGQREDGW